MTINIEKLKNQLNAEKRHLVSELNTIGVKSSDRKDDWNSVPDRVEEIDTRDEVAERIEELSTRRATETELEPRLRAVNGALSRIEAGTYGKCRVDDGEIEEDRLLANPAAKTCKKHIDLEETFE